MGDLPPDFHDLVVALYGADFDPKTIHVTYFKGDPHNKDEARWNGQRLASNQGYLKYGPAKDQNHFICMGVLSPDSTGRSLGNVIEHVAFWMDDVGTKVSIERVNDWIGRTGLFPTAVIHTSPGNYSYQWALDAPVKEDGGFDAQTVAAVRHRLKTDGWGDPAAQDAARYMRSGFGVNGKKKYAQPDGSPFKVEIAEFKPNAKVTLGAFAEAIMGPDWLDEVKSGKYLTSAQIAVHNSAGSTDRRATMDMPLVKLAGAIGLDPQPSTRSGVIDCRCPNEANHTGGDPTGYAIINDGMSFCNHASCQHLNSVDFQGLMIERYDAQIEAGKLFGTIVDNPFGPGLIDASTGEFVNETGSGFLAAQRFAGAPGPDGRPETVLDIQHAAEDLAARQVHEEELRGEARDAALEALFQRFVYVDSAGAFWDRKHGELIPPGQFETDEEVLRVFPLRGGDKSAVRQVMNMVGRLHHARNIVTKPYRADRRPNTDLMLVDGVVVVNRFQPTHIGFKPGTPQKFLDHLKFLYGDQPDVMVQVLEFMAFCVQYPDVKTSVIPLILIGGAPGIGKDGPLLQPFFALLGRHNVTSIPASKLLRDFNDFLMSPVIYMGEFSLAGADGERIYDRIKDSTSTDKRFIEINPKYGKTYKVEIAPRFIATSNNKESLEHVTWEDRRFLAAWSNATRLLGPGHGTGPGTDAYYEDLHKFYADEDNLAVLHHYLMNYKITAFNPNKAPPTNIGRHEILVAGLSGVAQFVYELMVHGDFASRTVVTWDEVEARCLAAENRMISGRVSSRAITQGLHAAGSVWIGRAQIKGGKRVQIWTGSKIELGNGANDPNAPKLGALDTAGQKLLVEDKNLAVATLIAEQDAAAAALSLAP
jgi:hypothetical protein